MRFDAPLQFEYNTRDIPNHQGCSSAINLSKGGIRFFAIKKISIGSVLELKFFLPGENKPVFAIGKIIWLKRKEEEEGFDAGIEFLQIDSFDRSRILAYAYDLWLSKRN